MSKPSGKHDIKDLIVAVEVTGNYHKPPMRAFRKAGYETRLVHPFASSYYRQPEHGDDKSDDNDLDAIFRAAVNGFGLMEKPIDAIHHQLQILARHRRDLGKKRSKLQRQIRHHLEQGLAGIRRSVRQHCVGRQRHGARSDGHLSYTGLDVAT